MGRVLLQCFAISFLAVICTTRPTDPQPALWFNVNLTETPSDRWVEVLDKHRVYVPEILKMIYNFVPAELLPLAEQIAMDLESVIPYPFAQEIIGVANYWGVSVGETLLLNIVYDYTAFCTSIVAQDQKGTIWHARNLDYSMGDLLRNLTVNVQFQSQGQTMYSGVTYAGYVGLLTGQRPSNFTITVDQRGDNKPYNWIYNILTAILDKSSSFVSFLIRKTLEESSSFVQAVDRLTFTIIHAPAYFIVGGVRKGEGVIITRDRIDAINRYYLDPLQNRWYVLETNYDVWLPEPSSDNNRSATGHREMDLLGSSNINVTTLFNVLSTRPVLNSDTTYTTVMSAGQPGVFTTWIRWP